MGLEMQNSAAEIKLRAERRAGEMLAKTDKHAGGRPNKNRRHAVTSLPAKLKEMGIAKKQSSRWQTIAALPEEEFEGHVQEYKGKNKEITTAAALTPTDSLRVGKS